MVNGARETRTEVDLIRNIIDDAKAEACRQRCGGLCVRRWGRVVEG